MYDILLPSVVIRLLLRIKSSSKLASVVFSRHLQLRNETPNLSSLFVMAVPLLYFLLQRAFSLSLSLSLPPSLSFVAEMCYQSFTSLPSLQNCAPTYCLFLEISGESFNERKRIFENGWVKENIWKT
ncbi:hypothetical protein GOODEAATRI_002698 [Goodea atripinnis]|uniref:Uncharacterized protein n=1 Tax=Goodea atripinnis TaxID=208336 RepID=A0ABV0MGI7_9TELE